MKAWIPLTLLLTVGFAVNANADCVYPTAPQAPPDGATATKDQMIAAKHDFDRYNGEMTAYLNCLSMEIDSAGPKDTSKLKPDEKKKVDEQKNILIQKNNAAYDELQAAVGRFNEQLKIFKAKAAANKS
ncbi:MAG TPA: hypothetical protein VHZ53_01895 [Steroidobacteraceae bacterium]|jgi:hypothetical protein|nr:hypothetical protein [Steroidobacteraceae bacterium]